LQALVENRLMDHVDGTTDCPTIAAKLELHPDFTCRFLRAGISLGLVETTPRNNVYQLTITGQYFQHNHPDTVTDLYEAMHSPLFEQSLKAVATQSIKTGRSGVQETFGMEIFEYLQLPEHEHEGAVFDNAIQQISNKIAVALLADWMPPSNNNATVCDLGGGKGTIITALCHKHSGLKGILFDLPDSSGRAARYIEEAGLTDRITIVSGDFFRPLPEQLKACDVFYLKAIFHDWGDEACIKIIQNIKEIADSTRGKGAMIVGHDTILDIGDSTSVENEKKESDVTMMAFTSGGRERTKDEYFSLFQQAGLESEPRLIKLRDLTSIVEVDL